MIQDRMSDAVKTKGVLSADRAFVAAVQKVVSGNPNVARLAAMCKPSVDEDKKPKNIYVMGEAFDSATIKSKDGFYGSIATTQGPLTALFLGHGGAWSGPQFLESDKVIAAVKDYAKNNGNELSSLCLIYNSCHATDYVMQTLQKSLEQAYASGQIKSMPTIVAASGRGEVVSGAALVDGIVDYAEFAGRKGKGVFVGDLYQIEEKSAVNQDFGVWVSSDKTLGDKFKGKLEGAGTQKYGYLNVLPQDSHLNEVTQVDSSQIEAATPEVPTGNLLALTEPPASIIAGSSAIADSVQGKRNEAGALKGFGSMAAAAAAVGAKSEEGARLAAQLAGLCSDCNQATADWIDKTVADMAKAWGIDEGAMKTMMQKSFGNFLKAFGEQIKQAKAGLSDTGCQFLDAFIASLTGVGPDKALAPAAAGGSIFSAPLPADSVRGIAMILSKWYQSEKNPDTQRAIAEIGNLLAKAVVESWSGSPSVDVKVALKGLQDLKQMAAATDKQPTAILVMQRIDLPFDPAKTPAVFSKKAELTDQDFAIQDFAQTLALLVPTLDSAQDRDDLKDIAGALKLNGAQTLIDQFGAASSFEERQSLIDKLNNDFFTPAGVVLGYTERWD
ncbi:MAG: hypothetical protein WCG06_05665, partial [Candidatus Omnitrophota bacterium]